MQLIWTRLERPDETGPDQNRPHRNRPDPTGFGMEQKRPVLCGQGPDLDWNGPDWTGLAASQNRRGWFYAERQLIWTRMDRTGTVQM